MRIVVDLQGCQTKTSKSRGIGRYSMSFTQALARNIGEHEIWLLLNGHLDDTIEPIRAAFKDLIPRDQIRIFDGSGRIAGFRAPKAWRRQTQERRRNALLADLQPDFVHVSSLFEGRDAVTSIGRLVSSPAQSITLYDLIPLLNPTTHLKTQSSRAWYMEKLQAAKRADLLLAISESSRQEALDALGLPPERVVNVSSAADPIFGPGRPTSPEEAQIRARYGLVDRFLMYTGGSDNRKNVDGLIEAYAAIPDLLRSSHQLAIVCGLNDKERHRLEGIARRNGIAPDRIVFSGFIPEADLVSLYRICTLFVFPSLHEGFGLPILEAMSCGAPAIGGDNSSIREVIGFDAALFNASDPKAIARKIEAVLSDEEFRRSLRLHGLRQAKLFSWDRSAMKALESMESIFDSRCKSAAAGFHRP